MTPPLTPIRLTNSRADHIFPKLTELQIRRIAEHGHSRTLRTGEVLVEQGDRPIPFFVVVTGELETVRPLGSRETLITTVAPGEFTGEVNTLSGRRSMTRIRARDAFVLNPNFWRSTRPLG